MITSEQNNFIELKKWHKQTDRFLQAIGNSMNCCCNGYNLVTDFRTEDKNADNDDYIWSLKHFWSKNCKQQFLKRINKNYI